MDKELKHNLTAGETWVRGLFILLFAFFLVIARIVTGAVVVIQFLFTVFTGKTNDNLRNLGAMLSRYVYQCLLFVTYNSDDKPFPFDDWPDAEILAEEKGEAVTEIPTVKTTAKAKAAPKKKASTRKKSTTNKAASTQGETQPEAEVSPEADTGSPPEEPGNKPGS